MKKKKKVLALVLSASLITCLFGGIAIFAAAETDFTIDNPYAAVDWDTYGQFKANFHTHTTESDTKYQPAEMVEDYYTKGYDILALTDHDFTSSTWDRTDRPADKVYLTSERLAAINAGADRDGRGMIGIPYSTEQSRSDHLNTFWANFTNVSGATLESKIAQAESLGGISQINHLGRYTGGDSTANGGADGKAASSDPGTVAYYANLFEKYSSCVGMEIINKKDGDSYSDRILWDNILKQTMPARPVWGFSNDDSHSLSGTGFSYNMLLLPANNLKNVRQAMENGTFYAVARVAKRELGSTFVGSGPTPAITDVAVDEVEDSITITGTNYNKVEWVADGKVIATGTTIDLDNYEGLVSTYVRAQLEGNGGISFTQPFGVSRLESETVLVNGITLDPTEVTVKKGDTINVTATIAPANATDTDINWTTNNTAVATVSGGTVTAVGGGTAVITATTEDGGFTATCAVTVPDSAAPTVTITSPTNGTSYATGTSINFSGSAADVPEGDLSANLTWTSSIDGPIGSGASFSKANLSVGTHTIIASVTGRGGLTGSVQMTIMVTPLQSTYTFSPSADAKVVSSAPSANYGKSMKLEQRVSTDTRRGYLKFVVTGMSGTVKSAKMRVYCLKSFKGGDSAYLVSNNYKWTTKPWTESGLNWHNAPSLPGTYLSKVVPVTANTWVEFDVTAAVTGNGVYSFALAHNATTLSYYSTKEAAQNQPELVIEMQ